ncbi:MAG: hypothetical protein R3E58_20010 [Phycisphaerae bacterium]
MSGRCRRIQSDGESDVLLPYSLATSAVAPRLGFESAAQERLAKCSIVPFLLRPGDETSCQNLYVKTQPRIIGAMQRLNAVDSISAR